MQMEITAFWKPANIPKWSSGPPQNMMLVACSLTCSLLPAACSWLACSLLPVACSLPPRACSLQLVACSPWKPFVYIDVNIAIPRKLCGDKQSDVNENLWSLKVSDLEPWISGKCKALRKWHTVRANCDQGVILMDVQPHSEMQIWITHTKITNLNNNLYKSFAFHRKLQDFNDNLWKSIVFRKTIQDLNKASKNHWFFKGKLT